MAHRHEHLCSASQLWLPHPALCVVPPECFRGLRVWSGAMGSKSGKLRNIADCDTKNSPHSLNIQVKVTSLTLLTSISMSMLLDSRATGMFINWSFMQKHQLETTLLP